jgi:hypothetical protein
LFTKRTQQNFEQLATYSSFLFEFKIKFDLNQELHIKLVDFEENEHFKNIHLQLVLSLYLFENVLEKQAEKSEEKSEEK